jgi:hypothetical protein
MGAKLYISRWIETMLQVSKMPICSHLSLKLAFWDGCRELDF